MIKILLLILTTILTISGISQPSTTYKSIGDGDWGNGGTWDSNQVPTSNPTTGSDSIIITHTVTLNGDLDIKTGTVLIIEGCDTLIVTGNVTFSNGSTLIIDSCAVLIIDGSVTNNNNSTNINVNGTIVIGGDYVGGNGSELGGTGAMDISGSVTTDGDATTFGSELDCTIDCSSSDLSPLPVELIEFKGYNKGNINYLYWISASEINNEYYFVERSGDGKNWYEIGNVVGAGTTNVAKIYDFKDLRYKDIINYYQLTQVDFNGNSETFKTIVIDNSVATKIIVKTVNFMGQEVNEYYNGMVIEIYTDNSVRKFFRD